MTYSEFRTTLATEILSTDPTVVIINYNPVVGSNPPTATIDDIAILIENNLPQLQEATSITLSIPQSQGTSTTVNVQSSTNPVRRVDRGVVGRYYCYSLLTPSQRPIITTLPQSDTEEYTTNVSIEPTILASSFTYNPYNPLIGNTEVNRESRYRVQSDRGAMSFATKTNPVNIQSILSDEAVPATVQDSLYSDTGWSHARYEGTKLTSLNNNNTDPVLLGTFFEGAFFGLDIDDSYITGLDPTQITYTQYLSSGRSQIPQYEIEDLGLALLTPNPELTGTLIKTATPPTISPKLINFTIGDLLMISSSVKLEDEIMVVQPPITNQRSFPYESSTITNTLEFRDFRVSRGYADTPPFNLINNYPNRPFLFKLSKVKLYNIKGTIVQAVTAGKLLVKETGDILRVSAEGLIVGGNNRVEL